MSAHMKAGPDILFEDGEILVCRKRAGLATQSGLTGGTDLAGQLLLYLKEEENAQAAPAGAGSDSGKGAGNVSGKGARHVFGKSAGHVFGKGTGSVSGKSAGQDSGKTAGHVFGKAAGHVSGKGAGRGAGKAGRVPGGSGTRKVMARRAQIAGDSLPYLGVVHRLDQPVEGLLVFAKTQEAAADLSEQTRDGRMEKTYLALVHLPEDAPAQGHLRDRLITEKGGTRVAKPGEGDAKEASLTYRVLERWDGKGLLSISLETGRRHQIRVQLAAAGMPILGDRRYGKGAEGLPFPALCAASLVFDHPDTGERLRFSCAPSFSFVLDKHREIP